MTFFNEVPTARFAVMCKAKFYAHTPTDSFWQDSISAHNRIFAPFAGDGECLRDIKEPNPYRRENTAYYVAVIDRGPKGYQNLINGKCSMLSMQEAIADSMRSSGASRS